MIESLNNPCFYFTPPMYIYGETNTGLRKKKREWINVSYWWLVVTRKLKEWVRHWVYRFSRIWCVIEKRTCSRSKDNKNSWGFIATICLHLSILTLNMSFVVVDDDIKHGFLMIFELTRHDPFQHIQRRWDIFWTALFLLLLSFTHRERLIRSKAYCFCVSNNVVEVY